MASIRKMRNKWYARVVWRVNGKLKEIQIPLKTSSLTQARTRLKSVNNEEQDIIMELYINKDGGRYIFEQGERRFDNSQSDFSIPLINNTDNANADNANADNENNDNNIDSLNQKYSIVKTLKYFAIKKCTKLRKLRNVYIPTYENTF